MVSDKKARINVFMFLEVIPLSPVQNDTRLIFNFGAYTLFELKACPEFWKLISVLITIWKFLDSQRLFQIAITGRTVRQNKRQRPSIAIKIPKPSLVYLIVRAGESS